MSCSYCELCPSLPSGPGTVFLQSPQPLIKAKVEQALAGATKGEVTSTDQAFFVPSFAEFLSSLLQFSAWTALEKQDTILLFTPGSSFALSPNVEIRTLARWESLTNAGFLIDILSNNRLVSHFHPIWDLPRQTLFGYECLIRGQEANGALIPPSRLFGAAKENRLLFNLDRQARQSALRSAARFPVQTKLFINFVPTAIYDPIFCLESTVGLAHQLGITPDRVVFEVIETEEVDDWNHLEKILTFYRKNGFQIALDDVGSGYSSLNRLVQIRPDIIKIDLEIIRNIERDPVKQSVFRALAAIARENGIKLLAEGVETSEELAFVTNEGADLAQGYLWGPPSAELGVPQFEVHP
ncbi:MAG: EAL domain-containing protein [Spirochaetales bacterium]|nr:EAL domain-containing protein [Spirochaetales bacterium]